MRKFQLFLFAIIIFALASACSNSNNAENISSADDYFQYDINKIIFSYDVDNDKLYYIADEYDSFNSDKNIDLDELAKRPKAIINVMSMDGVGSDTPQELSYAFLFSYNEYEIQSIEDKGIFLVNRETEEKHLLIPPENMSYYVSLYGDYFTFINRTCVCMINLLTGERKIYDFNDCKNLVGDAYIFSFVIFDDIIYASPTGPRIYRYDMTNETAEFFNYPVDNINAGNHLLGLFTDGTNLYTVMERYGKKKLYMVTRFGENDFGFSIFEMKPLLE